MYNSGENDKIEAPTIEPQTILERVQEESKTRKKKILPPIIEPLSILERVQE
jgi:hypothetical protein